MANYSRLGIITLARDWVGKNEADGSYKEIIDVYNSLGVQNLPRKIKMQYGWSWCACFCSALVIKAGYLDIIPIEISCGNLQKKAAEMDIWQENDAYIPEIGDFVLYDWEDGKNYANTDNRGWPDHIGIIDFVDPASGYMIVIEGNYKDSVKRRTLYIDGRYIRGFITPKYNGSAAEVIPHPSSEGKTVDDIAHEVIAGMYGNGHETRRKQIEPLGFNYDEVRKRVNEILNGSAVVAKNPEQEQDQSQPAIKRVVCNGYASKKDTSKAGTYVTTTNLYCRDAAGSNKKALCIIPKGTKVKNYGFLNPGNPYNWLLIEVTIDGTSYVGFSYDKYLKKQ